MSDTSTNTQPKSAAAIVGIILGAIALLTSFLPFINNFSFFFALIGVIFGIVGLVGTMKGKKGGKGLAVAAVIANVLAVVIVLVTQNMYASAIDQAIDDATVSTTDGTVASAETTSADDAAASDNASKYTIADEAIDGDEWSSKITGTFTNTSGKEFSYISVSYNLYDADGNQIGTAVDSTSNLADGGTWKFEAYGSEPLADVANYTLADVTGF